MCYLAVHATMTNSQLKAVKRWMSPPKALSAKSTFFKAPFVCTSQSFTPVKVFRFIVSTKLHCAISLRLCVSLAGHYLHLSEHQKKNYVPNAHKALKS